VGSADAGSRTLEAAVVGVGHLGRHHARIYAGMPGVRLAAVVDADRARAEEMAAKHGARAFGDVAELLASGTRVDLASVVVPTKLHFAVATAFLERRVPVLVEKPMTATLDEARALTKAAKERGVCLQVGHVERFHPALRAAQKLAIEPRFIESHRLAPFSFRSTDVGVVLDLMIHDLDIVLHLVRSPIKEVRAVGGSLLTKTEDIASARIEFEDGAVANLTASRVSLNPMRRTRVFSRGFFLSLDFGKKYAFIARKADDFEQRLAQKWMLIAATPPEKLKEIAPTAFRDLIEIQELTLDDEEPLQAELASFVNAVRTGSPPEVSADDAMRALEAAEAVLADIRRRRW
jgi:predicted dehydrogenase